MSREEFVPPASIDAEQALLGALLLWNDAQDDLTGLRATDFYEEVHQKIFTAIMQVLQRGQTADVVSVFEHMRETGEDADLSYLQGLTNSALSRKSVRRHCEIIIERATRRAVLRHCAEINDQAYGAISTADLLEKANTSLSAITDGRTSSDPVTVGSVMSQQLQALDARAEAFRSGHSSGLTTGLPDLDRQLGGGLRSGELVIIAGRPAMGKSALAENIALRSSEHGAKVLVFSQEMTIEENINRWLSTVSGVPLQALRTGEILQEHWSQLGPAADKLSDLSLHVDDQRAMRLLDCRSKARSVKRKYGLDLIIVDYLQLMVGEGENRTQEIGSLSRGLKHLAGELHVPIIALSQLNRGLEQRMNKRPVLSDLRESGDIEADADIVIMLYRDEVYNANTQEKGVAEVIVSKQRNGPIGTVYTAWDGETATFRPLANYTPPPPPNYSERNY